MLTVNTQIENAVEAAGDLKIIKKFRRNFIMKTGRNYKFWFCTGSQDLYGDECLRKVEIGRAHV